MYNIFMIFRSLSECNLNNVINFLLPYESSCIRLCECVKKQKPQVIVIFDGDEIWGVLGLETIITHCLPGLKDLSAEGKKALALEISQKISRSIFSINGEMEGTDFLVKILEDLGEKVHHRYDYVLMEKRSGECQVDMAQLNGGEEIVACTIHMEEELKGLQRDYLNVEVAAPGEKVTDLYVHANLVGILREQVTLALVIDEEYVAKANTSGRGWTFVQIGGVFTHPLYRRNGYARILVGTLVNRILRGGKYASLFVKEKNRGAYELYRAMGFSEVTRWSIAYYRKN